jgi:hypothetical protein
MSPFQLPYEVAAQQNQIGSQPTQSQTLDAEEVKVTSIAISVAGGYNSAHGFNFDVRYDITGLHLEKVEIEQDINNSTSFKDFNGHNLTSQETAKHIPANTKSITNTDNKFVTDTKWSWGPLNLVKNAGGVKDGTVALQTDTQALELQNTVMCKRVSYTATKDVLASWLIATTRYYHVYTRVVGSHKPLMSVDWGYKWNNYNCTWGQAEAIPPPANMPVCTRSNKGRGVFYDVQTIKGLTGL